MLILNSGFRYLILAAPLMLLSCGSETPNQPADSGAGTKLWTGGASYERLELVGKSRDAAELEEHIVQRISVDDEEPAWIVTGSEVKLGSLLVGKHKDAKRRKGLRVKGEGSMIEIPGPFSPGSINSMVLTMILRGSPRIKAVACLSDGRRLRIPRPAIQGSSKVQTIIFDLSLLRDVDADVTKLVAAVEQVDAFSLFAADLWLRPWEQWLPDAEGSSQLADLDGLGHRSIGIATNRGLSTSFEVRAGQTLEFHYGHAEQLLRTGEQLTLNMKLTGERGAVVERSLPFAVKDEEDTEQSWQAVSIPLDQFLDQSVEAQFELTSSAEYTSYAIISEPALIKRAKKAPTVVLITSDTHRADYLSFAEGGIDVQTPFLESFAARGVYFEDVATAANLTRPSHTSLLTGVTPRDTGLTSNESFLVDAARTLPEVFSEAGYLTIAGISASPLYHAACGLGQGFDRVTAPYSSQRDSSKTLKALETWMADAEGLPLFIWLHIFDAHAPYSPPKSMGQLYYPKGKDPRGENLPDPPPHSIPDFMEGVRDLAYIEAMYRMEITYLDGQLKKFLSLPRMDQAIVALTSDHGESLTTHNIYWSHAELYPNTLKVPLIMVWPGAPAGTRVAAAVRQVDVGRTLLDLAGESSAEFPGINILDDAPRRARFAMSAFARSSSLFLGEWFCVLHLKKRLEPTSDNKKLIELHTMHSIELYNLAQDPKCLDDLSESHRDVGKKMRAQIVTWLLDARTESWNEARVLSDAMKADLAALGYTSGAAGPKSNTWFNRECSCRECLKYQ